MMDKSTKVKILFLDDEERILNSLKAVFRFQYDVLTATNGSDALQILQNHEIAVVISDQRMPEMTGVEFLREAKMVSPLTVRILLTGFSDLSAVIDSVNDGEVFRFLNKPWGNQEIKDIVSEAISVYEALKEGKNSLPQDTASTAPALKTQSEAKTSIIMVKCRNIALFKQISSAAEPSMKFVHASTQGQALEILQNMLVDVIIIMLDEAIEGEDSVGLLKLLKREIPALVAIGLVESADYDEIIGLINEAKVYRYIVLPTKTNRIIHFTKSALEHTRQLKLHPELLRKESVMAPKYPPSNNTSEETGAAVKKLSIVRKIMSRMTGEP